MNASRQRTSLLVLFIVDDGQRAPLVIHAFRLEPRDQIEERFFLVHGSISVGLSSSKTKRMKELGKKITHGKNAVGNRVSERERTHSRRDSIEM